VTAYARDFAGTHCAYPRRDGQAELTWVAGYITRWSTRLLTVIFQVLTGTVVATDFVDAIQQRYRLSKSIAMIQNRASLTIGCVAGNKLNVGCNLVIHPQRMELRSAYAEWHCSELKTLRPGYGGYKWTGNRRGRSRYDMQIQRINYIMTTRSFQTCMGLSKAVLPGKDPKLSQPIVYYANRQKRTHKVIRNNNTIV